MWKELRADLARYVDIWNPRPPRLRDVPKLVTEQAVWATTVYRFGSWAQKLPNPFRRPVLAGYLVAHKVIEITTGISVPASAKIGPGLFIGHFGGILIHPECTIGKNCNLAQGVNIGTLGFGQRIPPRLGDNVYVGAGAKIFGDVKVGDGAVIGANAVVIRDVPPNMIAVGVPARVIPKKEDRGPGALKAALG